MKEQAKMGEKSSMAVKLIPEFAGDGSVTEWLEKVDLVCELQGITDAASVVPLRLTKGAFSVYQQIPKEKKNKISDIKQALLAAFAVNSFAAYEQFTARRMYPGESPDVYLASLRSLADRFGGVADKTLICAFVTGLPDGVRQLMRAGVNMENMKIETALTRARAVLLDVGTDTACSLTTTPNEGTTQEVSETCGETCAATMAAARGRGGQREARRGCFKCGGPNHFARHCRARAGRESVVRCYKCDEVGHIAPRCPGIHNASRAGNE